MIINESSRATKEDRQIIRSIVNEVLAKNGVNNSIGTYDSFIRRMVDNWAGTGHDRKFLFRVIENSFHKFKVKNESKINIDKSKSLESINEAVTWKVTKLEDAIEHLEIISTRFDVKWDSADAYDYIIRNANLSEVIKVMKSKDYGLDKDSVMTLSYKGLKYSFDLSKRDKSLKKKYMIRVAVMGLD